MKQKVVSSKTHTQQQLNDYANQHNPNNKAYIAMMNNRANQLNPNFKGNNYNNNKSNCYDRKK